MKSQTIVLALLLVPEFAVAQTPKLECAQLTEAYEHELKLLALSWYGDPADSSAIRAGIRQQEATNALLMIQANLTLMGKRSCQPPPGPVSPDVYGPDARQCGMTKASKLATQIEKMCTVSNWMKRIPPA